jgi:4-hydroxybenzoate polyprenyltransferase
MRRRLHLLLVAIRPAVVVILALFAGVGMSVATSHPGTLVMGRVLVVVMALLVFAANTNDISDEAIDRVNLAGDRRRPLVVGSGTRTELKVIAATAGILAVVTAATLGWLPLAVTVGGLVLSAAYSLRPVRLADRGAVASMLLPACYVAVPYLVAALSVERTLTLRQLALLAGLYVGFIGRILLKDFRDVRGDALFGKRTFLVRHGRRATLAVSASLWTAGGAIVMAVTGRAPVWMGIYMALLALTWHLFARLDRCTSRWMEERLISASAIIGRGTVLLVWMHQAMASAGWTAARTALVGSAFALLTAGQALAMVAYGPRQTLTVPAAWADEASAVPVAAPEFSSMRGGPDPARHEVAAGTR